MSTILNFNKFFKELTSIRNIKLKDDQFIDYLFDELLKTIPNNGKLYKYRAFSSKYFDDNLDAIAKGYIFLPSASVLNDKIDTTFIYKTKTSIDAVEEYYRKNKYKIFLYNVSRTSGYENRFNKIELFVFDSLANDTLTNTIFKVSKMFNQSNLVSKQVVERIKANIEKSIYESMDSAKNAFQNLDILMQRDYHIYSLCEDFNQDSMWAYYSDSNLGYCIEYDFKKGRSLPRVVKECLVKTLKVNYSNFKDEIDLLKVYDVIYKINKNEEDYSKINYLVTKSLITKRRSWEHEKEWRIVSDDQDRIDVDLVSGIIIDEKAFDDENIEKTKKLLKIAEENQIQISVRVFDRIVCDYKYITLDEFMALH